jgi:hypothetical protein
MAADATRSPIQNAIPAQTPSNRRPLRASRSDLSGSPSCRFAIVSRSGSRTVQFGFKLSPCREPLTLGNRPGGSGCRADPRALGRVGRLRRARDRPRPGARDARAEQSRGRATRVLARSRPARDRARSVGRMAHPRRPADGSESGGRAGLQAIPAAPRQWHHRRGHAGAGARVGRVPGETPAGARPSGLLRDRGLRSPLPVA